MFTTSCWIFAIIHPRLLNSQDFSRSSTFQSHCRTTVLRLSPKKNKCSRLNKIIQWNSKRNFIFNGTKKYSPSQLLYLLYLFSFLSLLFFPSKKTQQNKLHSFLHTIKHKKQTSQVLFSNTYPHVSCTKLMIINVFSTYNPFKLSYLPYYVIDKYAASGMTATKY